MAATRKYQEWKGGVHPATRTIYLGFTAPSHDEDCHYSPGELNPMDVELFICGMHALEAHSHDLITIKFQTIGGCEYLGLAVYDALKYSPCKTRMIVCGQSMSMGAAILQGATERVMMPNSTFMMHAGFSAIEGHPKNNERSVKENQRLDKIYYEIIAARSGMTAKKVRELCTWDHYLDAKAAIKSNLADAVFDPRHHSPKLV